MKIGIDISQLAFPGSGVARYNANLVKALTQFDKKNTYTFFYSSLRKKVPEEISTLITHPHRLITSRVPPTLLSVICNDLRMIPVETVVGNQDVFMTSDWTEPPSRKAIKITTVHDMVAYRYPETTHAKSNIKILSATISPNILAQQKKRLALVKKESTIVFADSNSTKRDIELYLSIPLEKIKVLYPAVVITKTTSDISDLLKKYNINRPYFITVGKREPRKNLERLLDAYSTSNVEADLLVIGAQGWNTSIEKDLPAGVRLLDFVSDADLSSLYTNALFFIYPSLYEGFGYPVVESMGYGCPVATSNTSSLKEISEGYSLQFNPESTNDIIKAIITLCDNAALREELKQKGLKRYKDYSLQLFAQNFVKIIDELHHDNRG